MNESMSDKTPPLTEAGPKPWNYLHGLVLCALIGVFFGAFFIVVAVVRTAFTPAPAPTLTDALVYVSGFTASGVLAGLMNPIARRISGAVVLGVMGLVPAALAWNFIDTRNVVPSDSEAIITLSAMVIIFGICFGLIMWDLFVKPRGGVAPWR
jgi:uncharacterized membrane protein